jgi:hypothetical protein
MAPWDKITFAICRILAMVPCILLAANTVGIFSAIGASPLPPGIPHRNEIYLSQGLSAGTVRLLLLSFNMLGKLVMLLMLLISTRQSAEQYGFLFRQSLT